MYDFLNDALFPKFRKFVSEDYSSYTAIYKKYFAPHADISPANLLEWLDIDDTLEISRLDDAIILKYNNPFEDNDINYLILEPVVSKDHIQKVYKHAGIDSRCIIREQPKLLVEHLENDSDLVLAPNRTSNEYILDVNQHASVEGTEFYRQRYEVRAFERIYSGRVLSLEVIQTATKDHKSLLSNLLGTWQLTANIANSLKDNREREAIERAIESLNFLNRPVAILFLDDQPVAFALFATYGDTAIVGHVKVDYDFPFIFNYMVHRLAKHFAKGSIRFINFEQDLGIDGLRAHKRRLRPIRMIEKVDITLRAKGSRSADNQSDPAS